MNEANICKNIAALRKSAGLTQEALATQLGVTYQAVSKWENNLSCPDLQLLPAIADIFNVSIDSLFDRETPTPVPAPTAKPAADTPDALVPVDAFGDDGWPWPDDDTIYVALFHGHDLINEDSLPLQGLPDIPFVYSGASPLNIYSALSVHIDEETVIHGSVECGGDLDCGSVGGHAWAGGSIDCGSIGGDAFAEGDIDSGSIGGDASCNGSIDCGSVAGNAICGDSLDCGSVLGNVTAGGDVDCSTVTGSVTAGGDVDCGDVGGRVTRGVGGQPLNPDPMDLARDSVDAARKRLHEAVEADDAPQFSYQNKSRGKRRRYEFSFDTDGFKKQMDSAIDTVEKALDGMFDKLDFGKKNKKDK